VANYKIATSKADSSARCQRGGSSCQSQIRRKPSCDQRVPEQRPTGRQHARCRCLLAPRRAHGHLALPRRLQLGAVSDASTEPSTTTANNSPRLWHSFALRSAKVEGAPPAPSPSLAGRWLSGRPAAPPAARRCVPSRPCSRR
jgi:hypothetical protein